jgi:hypothetical protein
MAEIAATKTVLLLEAIPHATHGFDQLPEGSKPLANSEDSDIDRPVGNPVVWTLNAFDDLLSSENSACMACQKMEKLELRSRHRERLTVNEYLHSRWQNSQPAEPDRGWILHHGKRQSIGIGIKSQLPTGALSFRRLQAGDAFDNHCLVESFDVLDREAHLALTCKSRFLLGGNTTGIIGKLQGQGHAGRVELSPLWRLTSDGHFQNIPVESERVIHVRDEHDGMSNVDH